MTTVYQTDADGFFMSFAKADPDPMNEGEWLVPGGCVLQAPPAAGEKQAARWSGTAWELVSDLRGTVYWTAEGQRLVVTERGVGLPDGASLQEPALTSGQQWVSHQAQARAALDASDITMIRCVEHGVTVPAEWVSYRGALRAIVRAASGDPTQPLPSRPAYPAGT